MSSQVVTFYEDKEMTKAILPRTKVSAISDDSGTALSEMVLYHGDGIDSGRALIDADLLQGHDASYFTSSSDFDTKVEELNTAIEELNTAIANAGKFYGIDTSNLLASGVTEYTATGDCIALVSIGRNGYGSGNVYIDGVSVIYKYHEYGPNSETYVLPLKNGQKVTVSSQNISIKIFGIKS